MPHRISMFQSAFASVTSAAAFALGIIIDEKAVVPIGTFLAVFLLVSRIANKFQRIVDKLDANSAQARRFEEAIKKIESMPCLKDGTCPIVENKKAETQKTLKMIP